MAVKTVTYLGNTALNTARGPSENIWGPTNPQNAGVADFIQDPRLGMNLFDDFVISGFDPGAGAAAALSGNLGAWSVYIGSTAQIRDAGLVGGVLQFVSASIAVASGASTPTAALSTMTGAFQLLENSSGASAMGGRLAFECRLALTSVTDVKRAAFAGLIGSGAPSATTPFLIVAGGSSNELASTRSLIGFYFPSSGHGGDCRFVWQLANTAAVFGANLTSLVSQVTGSAIAAGTFYKLGFVFDPNGANDQVTVAGTGQSLGQQAKQILKVYVNGMEAATYLSNTNVLASNFPTGTMGPCVAFAGVSNSGTSNSATNLAGLMNLDWIRVAQNNLV